MSYKLKDLKGPINNKNKAVNDVNDAKSSKLKSFWQVFNKTLNYSLNPQILSVIEEEFKFDKITKVQNSVIPYFVKNKDVIVKVFNLLIFFLTKYLK